MWRSVKSPGSDLMDSFILVSINTRTKVIRAYSDNERRSRTKPRTRSGSTELHNTIPGPKSNWGFRSYWFRATSMKTTILAGPTFVIYAIYNLFIIKKKKLEK